MQYSENEGRLVVVLDFPILEFEYGIHPPARGFSNAVHPNGELRI